MDKETIQKKILELFSAWHNATMFDSTHTWGKDEYKELLSYCREHIDDFKEMAKESLLHPAEHNYRIAMLCDALMPEIAEKIHYNVINLNDPNGIRIFKRLINNIKNIVATSFANSEASVFSGANDWANYFNGTENVNYYKDYIRYKDYLNGHYIPWNPFHENDPNPTYEQFIEMNKNK